LKLVASDVTVVVLKDTGHWVLEEQPQETTDALMKFLRWKHKAPWRITARRRGTRVVRHARQRPFRCRCKFGWQYPGTRAVALEV